MRVGVLTGGGDCPGLNAVIRAVVRKGVRQYGFEFVGLPRRLEGPARGLTDGARHRAVPRHPAPRRHDPRLVADQPVQDRRRRRADQGEPRAPTASTRWSRSAARTPSASRPSSPTSASRWSASRRRSTTTSPAPTSPSASTPPSTSPPRPSTGCTRPPSPTTGCSWSRSWAATPAGSRCTRGIAGGANIILIPEQPFDIDEVCEHVETPVQDAVRADHRGLRGRRPRRGRRRWRWSVGRDSTRSGTCGSAASATGWRSEIEARTGKEARAVVLGHIQRGGTPTAFDRWLATRFGLHAIDAVARRRLRHDGGAARHRHRPASR